MLPTKNLNKTNNDKYRITYGHLTKIVKMFKKDGFITSKLEGRTLSINFTTKGEKLKQNIDCIIEIINNIKTN